MTARKETDFELDAMTRAAFAGYLA
jgi:hypothetical protein